jgi:hypothetical protein
MKKKYSNPDIVFESFSLDETIASANTNCTRNITNMYSNVCGMYFGEKLVFTIAAAGCQIKIQDGSPLFDGLCYHIPVGDNKLFNS